MGRLFRSTEAPRQKSHRHLIAALLGFFVGYLLGGGWSSPLAERAGGETRAGSSLAASTQTPHFRPVLTLTAKKVSPQKKRPRPAFVTVVDGDSDHPVAAALVRIGRQSAVTGNRGRARLVVPRSTLLVEAKAHGYRERRQRFSFKRSGEHTIRIYRPDLQWPIYGVTPTRTQAHPRISLRPPFRIAWSRNLGSLVEFPAVVSDGVAYVANSRGIVRAISMRTGKVAWRRRLHSLMAASPAITGRSLVVHTMGGGYVYVLRRSDGRILWRKHIGSPIESSPVIEHGVDYFGCWDGRVYALNLRHRRIRWRYHSGHKITASAALSGKTVYIGDYGGRLLALDKRDGKPRFIRLVNGKIYGAAAVADGRVFVPSSTGNSLTAFTSKGRRLWRRLSGGYVYSSPAVWRGRVFFGSYDGILYCVDAASGRTLWKIYTGGAISGAPAVVSGIVYAGNFAHRIYAVDALSGRVRFRFGHGQYAPVSGNGRRLLFHGHSAIWAVEPKTRTSAVGH